MNDSFITELFTRANESNTDWNLFFATIFLGLCALFVPYVSKWAERNVYAPKLKVLFKLEPPYCYKTELREKKNQLHKTVPVYQFLLRIENEGKSQAKKCEVLLENMWIYDAAGNPKKLENFRSLNLSIFPDFMGIVYLTDLNPKRSSDYIIGHITPSDFQNEIESKEKPLIDVIPDYNGNDLRFLFDMSVYLYSQPNCLIPGKYMLQFGIYSENAGYQKTLFDISWTGRWQDRIEDMFREIVITQKQDPFDSLGHY